MGVTCTIYQVCLYNLIYIAYCGIYVYGSNEYSYVVLVFLIIYTNY